MPLISAVGRQRQVDLCTFKASLFYTVSPRMSRAPVSKKKPKKPKTKQKPQNQTSKTTKKEWRGHLALRVSAIVQAA